MKVAIVGAIGSIGSKILEHMLYCDDITSVVTITRKPLRPTNPRVTNAIIPDFGDLASVPDTTWSPIQTADALIWAMGTYDLNENVNYTYPLAFQRHLSQRLINSQARKDAKAKFKFILLGGALTETDQSRWLTFLPDQRRMKGLLQTKTLEFAELHSEYWAAHVIRPGGILMNNSVLVNWMAGLVLGNGLLVKGNELGAFVAHLVLNGSERNVIENAEIAEIGRRLVARNTE